jgi:hypothetical protein
MRWPSRSSPSRRREGIIHPVQRNKPAISIADRDTYLCVYLARLRESALDYLFGWARFKLMAPPFS